MCSSIYAVVVAKMLFVPLGKNPPSRDPNRRRPINNVMNLVHCARESDRRIRIGRHNRARHRDIRWQRQSRLHRSADEGAALFPTVNIARNASTLFAAARYGYAAADPAAIARPVSEVRTYPA